MKKFPLINDSNSVPSAISNEKLISHCQEMSQFCNDDFAQNVAQKFGLVYLLVILRYEHRTFKFTKLNLLSPMSQFS